MTTRELEIKTKNLDEAFAVGRVLQIIGVDNAVLQPGLVIVGVRLHPHAKAIGLEACPV